MRERERTKEKERERKRDRVLERMDIRGKNIYLFNQTNSILFLHTRAYSSSLLISIPT